MSCTDDGIAFDEPSLSLADSAGGLLGYLTESSKRSPCGNCHGEFQAKWVASGHAGAWATLQASSDASESCEGCHSLTELGNVLVEPAGHNVVPDTKYTDVQCESCHGPDREHPAHPFATQPLASILAGSDLTNGCGECHAWSRSPALLEWSESRHASPSSYAAGRDGCAQCHEGKEALSVKFGSTANYLEKTDTDGLAPITCAVCHDPHGSDNDAQLRASIRTGSEDNLCVRCHNRIAVPPSSHGPHAAQGPLVLGLEVGWIPPNFDTSLPTVATHGSDGVNERLCVTCHVVAFDDETNDVHSTGHTFRAAACLDELGLPTDGPCDNSERDFRACVGSGCHATEADALDRYEWLGTRLNNLLDAIWFDTDADGRIDVSDAGLLPRVVALGDTTELDLSDETVTVAEGVLWNAQLAHTSDRPWFGDGEVFGATFSAHRSSGNGVHNGFYLRRLLTASIEALVDEYDLTAVSAADR